MEPLPLEFRELLKRNHPRLTDADIDRVEQLSAQRFLINPQEHPDQLRALDHEREQLIEKRMPDFEALWERYSADEPQEKGD